MIENSRQYQVTKEQLAKFQESLEQMSKTPPDNIHPRLWQASREGAESKVKDLQEEIAEYEASLHPVVKDYCGWNETIPRLTCFSCSSTLIRHSWINDEVWQQKVAQFKIAHPHERIMSWEEYKKTRG